MILRVAELVASFADLVMLVEQAIHRANRTQVGSLIEQSGVHLGRRVIDELRGIQRFEHGLAFLGRKRSWRWRTFSRRNHGSGRSLRRPAAVERGPRNSECFTGWFHADGGGQFGDGVQSSVALFPG